MPSAIRAGVVYRITCEANGRTYIGSTVREPRQRWLEHLHYLRKGTHHARHMQKVFAKYGEGAMRFEVIEHVADQIYLQAREQFQMWRYDGALMNGKAVVDQPVMFTEEVRAKMSVKRRARPSRPCSDETKANISAAKLGKKNTAEHVAASVAGRVAWIATELPDWLAMVRDGMSYRTIEKVTGRSRDVIARACRGAVNV